MKTRSDSRFDATTPNRVVELEAQVQSRLGGQVRDLQIVVTSEGITLHGCAHTYHAQQLAAEVVAQHSTLPIAANAIEVL